MSRVRIEAYDVAHMSGKNMVGVMTVVIDGEAAPREYKKFIIKTQSGSNDIGALEEILSRRLRHTEWGIPDIIVTDGGVAQKRVGEQVSARYQWNVPVVSVVKDDSHKAREILGEQLLVNKHKRAILLANVEAHRFAIAFHKEKRAKNFLK
jgi:excinuclease ABC subunit C